jgi:hypothetical protein
VGFKEDADFARYVSMGAVATDAVRTDLKRYGHEAIELERFAMANKVWHTKVKRMRLPDLVCVKCGLRVESRGKSNLGIIASHSETDGRAWDAGMRDGDLYAFARVDIRVAPPYASEPVYFRKRDLHATAKWATESTRKAASEGSEMTLTWKSWVPKRSGIFVDIDTEGRLVCHWDDGRSYRYGQWRKWPTRQLYLAPGDPIIADETMVAGLPVPADGFICTDVWDLRAALSDPDPGERYAAVRVAGVTQRYDLAGQLEDIARYEQDWRLRLEATASLARLDSDWTQRIVEMAATPANDDKSRMEAVFVLSEIPTDEAAEALAEIAAQDGEKPQELRAAAVWGLARGVQPKPDLILPYTVDDDKIVALHAIAGLPSLPEDLVPGLLNWLRQDDTHAAAAAQLLMRHEAVQALLTAVHEGGRARLWALRALGDLSPELVQSLGGELLAPEIECALEPIWIGRDDWLRGSGAEGLAALDVQKVRFNPLVSQPADFSPENPSPEPPSQEGGVTDSGAAITKDSAMNGRERW